MDKIRVAGYCRVSTNKQAEKGHSIDDQKQRILSYCTLHNYELTEFIIDDGATGSNLNRAGIERIKSLKDSKSVDGIIINKLDRLTRRARDFHILLDSVFCKDGLSLHSVTDQINTSTAIGRATVSLILTFSELELDTIKQRTSDALQAKKLKGEPMGQAPYGYKYNDNKELVKHADEQKVIAKIKRLRKSLTLKETQERLESNGHRSRRGNKFTLSFISELSRGVKRGGTRRKSRKKTKA